MKLKAIDHVTLRVRSLAGAKEYYQQVFGLACSQPLAGSPNSLGLETEAVHLFLIEDPHLSPEHIRAQHISFEVEELASVVKYLDSRGERYQIGRFEGFKNRNYRWCEWRDPEGIRVECVEPLKE